MAQKALHKRFASTGPIGRQCSCCFPPSGSKFRTAAKRVDSKLERRMLDKFIFEDVE